MIKSKNIFILLFVGIITTFGVLAQNTAVFVFPDSSKILLGDQINLNLTAKVPLAVSVQFPNLKDTLTAKVLIIKDLGIDSTSKDGIVTLSKKYLITSFDSGLYTIPQLPFIISNKNTTDTIWSSLSYLTVNSVPADSINNIYDIKDPYRIPLTFAEIWPWLAGAIVFVLLIILLLYYLKRKKEHKPFLKQLKPIEPAHIIALRELGKLKNENLWQKGQVKLFYSRLTEIIRTYLEQRFSIMAMEMTSSEILQCIHGVLQPESLNDDLYKLLSIADMVKFAKTVPLPDDNDRSLKNSYAFVEATKLIENNDSQDNTLSINDDKHIIEPKGKELK